MSAPSQDGPRSADAVGRVEVHISRLLRGGLLVSLVLVVLGVAVLFVHHPEYGAPGDHLAHLTSSDYRFPTTLGGVFRGVLAGQGRSIVLLGVFVLFLTPVLRVAASIVAFAAQRDWPFVVLTSAVLTFLVLSLMLGKAG